MVNLKKYLNRSSNIGKENINIYFLKRSEIKKFSEKDLRKLCGELNVLTTDSWGNYGERFIFEHVIKSEFLAIVENKEKFIAYAAVSIKNFNGKHYYYYEFLVVSPEYQGIGVSKELNKLLFKKIFCENLKNFNFSINFITVTMNPIVVELINNFSVFMYPSFRDFEAGIRNRPVPTKIWKAASEALQKSYNPNRKLDRVGLVLHNSYKDTPWLIYKKDKVPRAKNEKINEFCEYYLELNKEKGLEFIVVAKINIIKTIKFLFL